MKRLIAINSIMGDYTKLMNLMAEVKATKEDEIVFLGNYIGDAGQDAEVIDYLSRLRIYRKSWFLMGSNDSRFLDYLMGGEAVEIQGTLDSYGDNKIPWEHEQFFKNLRESIIIPSVEFSDSHAFVEYIFTHNPTDTELKKNQVNIYDQGGELRAAILPRTHRGTIKYIQGGTCTH